MATPLQEAIAKDTLLKCTGFNPFFLSSKKNISIAGILKTTQKKFLPKVEGNKNGYLQYENLTVLFNASRRLPFLSVYGIDAAEKNNNVKRTTFRIDPRIEKNMQLNQAFYNLRKDITEFEIGHMAANYEMAWGTNAQTQSYQTFHFPNSVPQAENLNGGIWRDLESYIVKEAASILNNKKIVVFTGPVLQKNDPKYKYDPNFQIPLLFFKVVVFNTTKGFYATAFIMSHEQKMIEDGMFLGEVPLTGKTRGLVTEKLAFENYKYKDVYQINLTTLEKLSGLKFSWPGVKKLKVPNDANKIEKLVRKPKNNIIKQRGVSDLKSNRETTLILP